MAKAKRAGRSSRAEVNKHEDINLHVSKDTAVRILAMVVLILTLCFIIYAVDYDEDDYNHLGFSIKDNVHTVIDTIFNMIGHITVFCLIGMIILLSFFTIASGKWW